MVRLITIISMVLPGTVFSMGQFNHPAARPVPFYLTFSTSTFASFADASVSSKSLNIDAVASTAPAENSTAVLQRSFVHWPAGPEAKVDIAYNKTVPDDATLPVQFNDVKAFSNSNGNEVVWTNLAEANLVRYEVERSADGRNFYTLAIIDPSDNRGGRQSYTWTDASPFEGNNFYRVKALEFSGYSLASAVVKINRDGEAVALEIFPRQEEGNLFSIQANGLKEGLYTIKVFDINGREVMHRFFKQKAATLNQTIELPASSAKGMYSLQIVNAGTKLIRNFVIQ
jgi:hypothetical protein